MAVYPRDRLALVGENGSGKTSLYRVLTGRLRPDAGEVSLARGLRIGHLEQDFANLDSEGHTCLEVALEPFAHLIRLERRINRLGVELARRGTQESVDKLLSELGEAQQRFEAAGGYGFRARTEAALSGLGLPESRWERSVDELSSGEKMRLALARAVLDEHDLLLLDEPTNHLDVPARVWLEEHLAGLRAAYVVASHDRFFLDRVATKVAHLDRGKLALYQGNYSAFRDQQREQTEADWSRYEKAQKKIRGLQKQAQTYQGWSNKAEREKRGATDKGFIGHKAAKLMKRSVVARRRLEEAAEAAREDKPFERKPVKIDFHHSGARHLLLAQGLAVGYEPGRPLAQGISLDLAAGDRLAIQGPNGCGKTTLLRTLLEEVPPLGGDVSLSPAARVGYFDQEGNRLPRASTALEAVLSTGRDETLCRTVMGRMAVRRETVNKPIEKLSAGERAKVLLATLILGEHNLLALDEPTNHLDIETQDVLLDALLDFPGGILFISHDRHFVRSLATETLYLQSEEASFRRPQSQVAPKRSLLDPYAPPELCLEKAPLSEVCWLDLRNIAVCCAKTIGNARKEGKNVGKVSTGLSMSLDGFIAGPNDGPERPLGEGGERLFAWYSEGDTEYRLPGTDMVFRVSPRSAELLREAHARMGAFVTGRRTFDITGGWGGRPPLGVPTFVLTHTVPQEWVYEGSPFTFVTEGIERAVERAKQAAGNKDVAVGAASIVQQCIRAGLLDEIHIDLVPVILGGGVSLFERSGGAPIGLQSTEVVEGVGVTHLTFRVVR